MRMLFGCLCLLLAASAAVAQSMPDDQASIKARCAQYAREDQVPEKELAAYMQDCINALSTGQSEKQSPTTPPPPSMRD